MCMVKFKNTVRLRIRASVKLCLRSYLTYTIYSVVFKISQRGLDPYLLISPPNPMLLPFLSPPALMQTRAAYTPLLFPLQPSISTCFRANPFLTYPPPRPSLISFPTPPSQMYTLNHAARGQGSDVSPSTGSGEEPKLLTNCRLRYLGSMCGEGA